MLLCRERGRILDYLIILRSKKSPLKKLCIIETFEDISRKEAAWGILKPEELWGLLHYSRDLLMWAEIREIFKRRKIAKLERKLSKVTAKRQKLLVKGRRLTLKHEAISKESR
jgi:hypothetical protein